MNTEESETIIPAPYEPKPGELPPDDTENCCLACNARGFNCEGIFRDSGERCCVGCRHQYSTIRPVDYWRGKAVAFKSDLLALAKGEPAKTTEGKAVEVYI